MTTLERFYLDLDPLMCRLHLLLAERSVIYFQPCELLYPGWSHEAGNAVNQAPQLQDLEKLADVAVLADRLRTECGFPLRVLSAFRSPKYNEAVGGAIASRHLTAQALDLAPVARSRMDALRKTTKALQSSGALNGGVGYYASFVHLDTGRRRTW